MVDLKDKVALIVGAGSGLSASIARVFANAGMRIALAARSIDDLAGLAAETGAKTFACDATDASAVKRLFADVAGAAALGDPYAVVYNASYRTRGPFIELDPGEVEKSIAVSAMLFMKFVSRYCAVRAVISMICASLKPTCRAAAIALSSTWPRVSTRTRARLAAAPRRISFD